MTHDTQCSVQEARAREHPAPPVNRCTEISEISEISGRIANTSYQVRAKEPTGERTFLAVSFGLIINCRTLN